MQLELMMNDNDNDKTCRWHSWSAVEPVQTQQAEQLH